MPPSDDLGARHATRGVVGFIGMVVEPKRGAMSEQRQRPVLWSVRAALVAAIIVTVSFPSWEQFEGKGMLFRAPFYLFPLIVVPVVWRLRGRPKPYPAAVDALVVAPFLLDTCGNIFGFYNNYDVTDDVLHFANWLLLIAGVTLALARTGICRLNAWTTAYGIGGLAIIWWEFAEYLVQEMGTAGLGLTYGDTIGDLLLSSTGGGVGAAFVVLVAWPRAAADEERSAAPAG